MIYTVKNIRMTLGPSHADIPAIELASSNQYKFNKEYFLWQDQVIVN